MATSFETSNQTLRQVLASGLIYQVPPFQRDYSWDADEWDDLWQDILATYDDDSAGNHYLGYLVLFTTDSKHFDVVDGQQRLTTVSILILAAIARLESFAEAGIDVDDNRKRAHELRSAYIGSLDPVSLTTENKLRLNSHNEAFYQEYLVPLRSLPQRGISASQHLLRKSYETFHANIKKRFPDSSADGAAVAQFVTDVVDRLFVTAITVDDEVNAFTVFETLNARGVKLSATDLLKNYLFSVLSSTERSEQDASTLERRWKTIVDTLQRESFPDFLRVHWMSRHGQVRKNDMFKVLRRRVTTREEAHSLVIDLENQVEGYSALLDATDRRWGPAESRYLALLRSFNARQHLPLTLACATVIRERDPKAFERILRALVVLTYRYSVISGLHNAALENTYGDLARKVMTSRPEDTEGQDVLAGLAAVYPSDDTFSASFRVKEFRATKGRNRTIITYTLKALTAGNADVDLDSASDASVEHVLPQNVTDGWEDFDDHQAADLAHRLGNMILIPAKLNRDVGNAAWATKKAAFAASDDVGVREFANTYDTWTPTTINERQSAMARKATSVWRIDFPTAP